MGIKETAEPSLEDTVPLMCREDRIEASYGICHRDSDMTPLYREKYVY